MEEVLADWSATTVGSIVLAAVSAVVTMRAFLGNEPLFRIPVFQLTHASELLIYGVTGVVGGLLSALFIAALKKAKTDLDELPHWRRFVMPAAGGFLTGLVGLWFPEVMGAGYEAINSALHGEFTWQVLLYLALLKLLVTLFCFTAGTPGGMFAPALFIGGMLGGAWAGLAHHWWPYPAASAEAYMLVGMGTFFAGVFRSPITSIFLVFELSASYVIILPVMIANTTAYLLSRKLYATPFFKMLAEVEGLALPSAEEKRNFRPLRVEDAMHELSSPMAADPGMRLFPDEPLDAALRLLSVRPRIQVVSRMNPEQVIATLSLRDVHDAYGIQEETSEAEASATEQLTPRNVS
jgi:CIC family chloride channel protein